MNNKEEAVAEQEIATDCRHFTGDRPCAKNSRCSRECQHFNRPSVRILLIHLGALGAVARSTSLLPAIHKRFPGAHVTWLTQRPADQILQNISLIDRVVTTEPASIAALEALEFDVALVLDKSLEAAGYLGRNRADLVYGFLADPRTGAILPATPDAHELWEIGLSNRKKFFENQKAETQLLHEALALGPFARNEYQLTLSSPELQKAQARRQQWAEKGETLIGLNTGCAPVIPYKKLSIQNHRDLIARLSFLPNTRIVLLGGREDAERNQKIAHGLGVIQSETSQGIRDGMASIAACDIVVSGDSLGMHLAIGLKKWVVAWFGPTCHQEIDLFDRGEKILTQAPCSPCWRRSCQEPVMCYDRVDLDEVVAAIHRYTTQKAVSRETIECRTY